MKRGRIARQIVFLNRLFKVLKVPFLQLFPEIAVSVRRTPKFLHGGGSAFSFCPAFSVMRDKSVRGLTAFPVFQKVAVQVCHFFTGFLRDSFQMLYPRALFINPRFVQQGVFQKIPKPVPAFLICRSQYKSEFHRFRALFENAPLQHLQNGGRFFALRH